jgi:hypothetical protein
MRLREKLGDDQGKVVLFGATGMVGQRERSVQISRATSVRKIVLQYREQARRV